MGISIQIFFPQKSTKPLQIKYLPVSSVMALIVFLKPSPAKIRSTYASHKLPAKYLKLLKCHKLKLHEILSIRNIKICLGKLLAFSLVKFKRRIKLKVFGSLHRLIISMYALLIMRF